MCILYLIYFITVPHYCLPAVSIESTKYLFRQSQPYYHPRTASHNGTTQHYSCSDVARHSPITIPRMRGCGFRKTSMTEIVNTMAVQCTCATVNGRGLASTFFLNTIQVIDKCVILSVHTLSIHTTAQVNRAVFTHWNLLLLLELPNQQHNIVARRNNTSSRRDFTYIFQAWTIYFVRDHHHHHASCGTRSKTQV